MLLALKAQIRQWLERSICAINNSPAKLNNNFKTRNFFIEKQQTILMFAGSGRVGLHHPSFGADVVKRCGSKGGRRVWRPPDC